jgi:hypothetical protein
MRFTFERLEFPKCDCKTMAITDIWSFFRFKAGMPVDYVIEMLRNLYRSERIRDRWRMAFNRIRNAFTLPGPDRRHITRISRGLSFNHPSRAWKNAVPRPPPVKSAYDDGNDDLGPAWSDFFRRRPGAWGRNLGRYSDAQDVIGFHLHPYRRPTENDEDFWPYTRNIYDPPR